MICDAIARPWKELTRSKAHPLVLVCKINIHHEPLPTPRSLHPFYRMSSLPIIVVFGSTGYQGGAVVDSLLQTQKFQVRTVTRDRTSANAQKLKDKSVQVVSGDANKLESLTAAFKGAWGAFLVTNFWDPSQGLKPDTDYIQGKNLVDAAVASQSVKFVVWSSLHDIEAASQGTPCRTTR